MRESGRTEGETRGPKSSGCSPPSLLVSAYASSYRSYATFLKRLDEVLHGPDPEAALNQFWNAVDQAYGKSSSTLEVRAGPIDPTELDSWSDEKIAERLKELEAESGSESEDGG